MLGVFFSFLLGDLWFFLRAEEMLWLLLFDVLFGAFSFVCLVNMLFCLFGVFWACLVFKKTFENNIMCCIHAGIASSQWRQTADPWKYELTFSLHYILLDPWMDFPLEKEHYLLSSDRLTHN